MTKDKKYVMDIQSDKGRVSRGELAELGGRKLVYIRAVQAADVIDDLEDEFGNLQVDIESDATLYSVHAADGERIALVGDRDIAFAAARQYEMNPVSVH